MLPEESDDDFEIFDTDNDDDWEKVVYCINIPDTMFCIINCVVKTLHSKLVLIICEIFSVCDIY